ncbi:hypothetical protein V499_02825 [Pseudogymnoascus sp. VKM F-103]|uniref:SnoaL-like domain-containing protein n=1 Tax=Pseudogymnoascus verrucosus TaxID=342668 RepID=A0A1B8G8I4_9PEZI|nr:uncharacterized protein VE01_10103 [Pseudogymnoascus verrucosus]KFY77890.1 hypothetical protein V499_02825 [Pseudogymnoascus sp. VKM F-103]OBT92138.1 hypothetical protein VE01_10103 [Pseudogymnoascus verrucosus]
MAVQLSLPSLTPREAVADALHRCILGIDTNNRDVFESACLKGEDMIITLGPATFSGWAAINELFVNVFKLITTHIASNIRVELEDGADTANLTAHVISYHVKPEDAVKVEDTSYTAGTLYDIDLVRDGGDGLWKIKRWDLKIQWTTGDKAVLHG